MGGAGEAAPKPTVRAFGSPTAWATLLGVLALGLCLDLGAKLWSFEVVAGTPVVLDRLSEVQIALDNRPELAEADLAVRQARVRVGQAKNGVLPQFDVTFRYTVDGLGEIIWWILGYGDQAEVLKPAALRNKIAQKIAAMQKTYTRKPPRRRPTKRRNKRSSPRSKKK